MVEFVWRCSIARPQKPPVIRNNLADISYTSRVIADFVPNFVAMATRVGRGKICMASLNSPTEKAVGPIFALNMSYDVVMRKEVPLEGEKNLFQNLTDLFEKFEKFIMAPTRKF